MKREVTPSALLTDLYQLKTMQAYPRGERVT
jgi:nicotinic acid phosphoribosyltransferase